jgi:hypothetical protein
VQVLLAGFDTTGINFHLDNFLQFTSLGYQDRAHAWAFGIPPPDMLIMPADIWLLALATHPDLYPAATNFYTSYVQKALEQAAAAAAAAEITAAAQQYSPSTRIFMGIPSPPPPSEAEAAAAANTSSMSAQASAALDQILTVAMCIQQRASVFEQVLSVDADDQPDLPQDPEERLVAVLAACYPQDPVWAGLQRQLDPAFRDAADQQPEAGPAAAAGPEQAPQPAEQLDQVLPAAAAAAAAVGGPQRPDAAAAAAAAAGPILAGLDDALLRADVVQWSKDAVQHTAQRVDQQGHVRLILPSAHLRFVPIPRSIVVALAPNYGVAPFVFWFAGALVVKLLPSADGNAELDLTDTVAGQAFLHEQQQQQHAAQDGAQQ